MADALKRIGALEMAPRPIVGAAAPDRYRNKAQYPVAQGEYRLLAGFYAPRSHRVVEQRDCRLQPEIFRDVLDEVLRWAKRAGVSAYDEESGQGLLRHVYIRQARATGEIMVCLVCTSGKLPDTKGLVSALRERAPGLATVVVNINRRDTNVILGEETFPLWGPGTITDELCGLRFRLSPHSFYQVNREQAERLYALAAEAAALTGKETLLDLYCGTGTIGLSMAARAARVIGVEVVPQAVETPAATPRTTALKTPVSSAPTPARRPPASGRKGCAPTWWFSTRPAKAVTRRWWIPSPSWRPPGWYMCPAIRPLLRGICGLSASGAMP